ncbi:MAG: restriction endonuclease, partial [Saprospiraceae bacterium]
MRSKLTIKRLKEAAKQFCELESAFKNKELFGVTDGKAVGTYIEHKFQKYLDKLYTYQKGSSSRGIDLPSNTI